MIIITYIFLTVLLYSYIYSIYFKKIKNIYKIKKIAKNWNFLVKKRIKVCHSLSVSKSRSISLLELSECIALKIIRKKDFEWNFSVNMTTNKRYFKYKLFLTKIFWVRIILRRSYYQLHNQCILYYTVKTNHLELNMIECDLIHYNIKNIYLQ